MAEHLASIFGTEKDRVHCPFNFKIGACRHGHRCARLHTKPSSSPTLLLSNMYQRPDMITPGVDPQGQPVEPKKIQNHFDDFCQDLFEELSKYGEVQNHNICDNLADHMVGNVYVQFSEEDHAAAALQHLTGRVYADMEKEPRSACTTPNAKVNHVIKVDEKGLKEETANAIGASVSKRGSPMDLLHELKKEGSKNS